jgi:hypothetical protein
MEETYAVDNRPAAQPRHSQHTVAIGDLMLATPTPLGSSKEGDSGGNCIGRPMLEPDFGEQENDDTMSTCAINEMTFGR